MEASLTTTTPDAAAPVARTGPADHLIGSYVIVRASYGRSSAGWLEAIDGTTLRLRGARRLYFWRAKQGHTLSAVANFGLKAGSKIPAPADVIMLDAREIIPVTEAARALIEEFPVHEP